MKEKQRIERVTGGIVRYLLIDENGTKNYIVEMDDFYLRVVFEDGEVVILAEYETEEEWKRIQG